MALLSTCKTDRFFKRYSTNKTIQKYKRYIGDKQYPPASITIQEVLDDEALLAEVDAIAFVPL